MWRMQPIAYKIGEGERKSLSKDMQEIIGALEEENKKLKEENEELKAIIEHYKKFEEGKERLEGMLKDIGEITSIKDGPITYTKDSTGKWVADGEPPYVLC